VVADESHRGTMIAFSSTLVAVEAMLLAGVLGGLAQNHATIWPDVFVLVLAIGATLASLGAPASEPTVGESPRAVTILATFRRVSAAGRAPGVVAQTA
jgi:predicted tellurium resistance membrane protein TerC